MTPENETRLQTRFLHYNQLTHTSEFELSDASAVTNHSCESFKHALEHVLIPVMEDIASHLRSQGHACAILKHRTRITMLLRLRATDKEGALWFFLLPHLGEVVLHFDGGQLGAGQGGGASLHLDRLDSAQVEERIVTALRPILVP